MQVPTSRPMQQGQRGDGTVRKGVCTVRLHLLRDSSLHSDAILWAKSELVLKRLLSYNSQCQSFSRLEAWEEAGPKQARLS